MRTGDVSVAVQEHCQTFLVVDGDSDQVKEALLGDLCLFISIFHNLRQRLLGSVINS